MKDMLTNYLMLETYAREHIIDLWKKYSINPEISLDERWDMFLKIEKLLPIESWIAHLTSMPKVSWYDEFYIDRYQTAEWSDIIETLEDRDEDTESKFDITAVKEEILSRHSQGFVCDW